ncbi:MAG: protein translocase subunit SecF [Alphaproteobacteria bacterium]|nr:protein translocase subunit SecF [Alphaproteobacteria bacterium]
MAMAWKLKLVPDKTTVAFMGMRRLAFGLSAALAVLSIVLLFVLGLNFGIDFRGGTLMQIKTPGVANIAGLRDAVGGLNLGEVTLQEYGAPDEILIRVERQAGEAADQLAAIEVIKRALENTVGGGIEYRRVEFVGPQVSAELVRAGALALGLALVAMLIYIWFRFEWQFSVGAVTALVHDVILTFGFFAITGLEFNLSIVAAILTIVGYSMNDTVVVYDRVRENLRKYKKMDLKDLIDMSINDTLSRTTLTSFTTLLALIALAVVGGPVIAGFVLAMIWGVVIGTYSSIFVAAPVLIYLGVRREAFDKNAEEGAGNTTPA